MKIEEIKETVMEYKNYIELGNKQYARSITDSVRQLIIDNVHFYKVSKNKMCRIHKNLI